MLTALFVLNWKNLAASRRLTLCDRTFGLRFTAMDPIITNDWHDLIFRYRYDDWSTPHTAAKLIFPFLFDAKCYKPPTKDEL